MSKIRESIAPTRMSLVGNINKSFDAAITYIGDDEETLNTLAKVHMADDLIVCVEPYVITVGKGDEPNRLSYYNRIFIDSNDQIYSMTKIDSSVYKLKEGSYSYGKTDKTFYSTEDVLGWANHIQLMIDEESETEESTEEITDIEEALETLISANEYLVLTTDRGGN